MSWPSFPESSPPVGRIAVNAETPARVPPNPQEALDAAVSRVASRKDAWTAVDLSERRRLLERCVDGLVEAAEGWVADVCRAKGISPDETAAGEEWIAGPWTTIRNARLLIRALESGGQPHPPKLYAREDGQLVARVFPASGYDRAMFRGVTAEVWIEPGRPASQGRIYREPSGAGRVALVLGAGNVGSALHKLLVENEVVVLETSPVNAYLATHWEKALAPFIEAGYLAIVHGGTNEGAYLATRPITAELGCVTPVLVVPGPWSEADMELQARHVAGMVAHNASFNLAGAQVLVVAMGWLQRASFLRRVEAALASTPPRRAYHPRTAERWRALLDHYPNARVLAGGEGVSPGDEVVPWMLIPDVPAKCGEYALSSEAFCGVLATVILDADRPVDFLGKAVEFANDSCSGTLSSTLLVHPSTREEYPREVDRAIAELRYGAIGVNTSSSLAYALASPTWGAFPGHPPEAIQSGTGVVHNALLFDHPQKSVVFAPFRMRPKPVSFAHHRNILGVGRKLVAMEARPSLSGLAGLAIDGLKG